MSAGEELSIELQVGEKGGASGWRLYLPSDSRALTHFREPVTVMVRASTMFGLRQNVIDTFGQLLPDILRVLADLTPQSTGLVYFLGPATPEELLSVCPWLPSVRDDRRFFVSEIYRGSRGQGSPWGRICVEYTDESLKQLTGRDGFDFPYGMTVMGLWVQGEESASYLKMNVLDKSVVEESLKSSDLRCWWFCDSDFEGMTIWHKDYAGDELATHLHAVIDGRVGENRQNSGSV